MAGDISLAEKRRLLTILNLPAEREAFELLFQQTMDGTIPDDNQLDDEAAEEMIRYILRYKEEERTQKLAHRVHFLKTAWVRYAAAIIIIFGISAYLWSTRQKEQPILTENKPTPVKNDVLPGTSRALLTLADGRTIVLDSAANGQLAREEGASIVKNSDGQIVYKAVGKAAAVAHNTMSTPRGGQYQLTLPDGTEVWLNAASSITYPTAFMENTRTVKIVGEAYFEVAGNPSKPFIVAVDGKPSVEVLGTHFNVNAYTDEPVVATTLLEGSVRTGNRILRPGQQARINASNTITIDEHVDVNKAMAWKNGVFNFEGADLKTVMRQLSRWYDLDVEYASGVPPVEFGGKLKRDLNLSQILKVLENSAVNFDLEGRRLIVKP
jgi:transmembrane sensor